MLAEILDWVRGLIAQFALADSVTGLVIGFLILLIVSYIFFKLADVAGGFLGAVLSLAVAIIAGFAGLYLGRLWVVPYVPADLAQLAVWGCGLLGFLIFGGLFGKIVMDTSFGRTAMILLLSLGVSWLLREYGMDGIILRIQNLF